MDEEIKFLEADFNQCFQQMRHYDIQLFDSVKFLSTAYVGLIGIGIGLYEFGLKESRDFSTAILVTFFVALLFGFFMYMVILRNRMYFVQVARYVNEIRNTFLENKPMGFENKSKMFTNCKQPPFFNRQSSTAYLMYSIASINSILCGAIIYILFSKASCLWCRSIAGVIILLVLQLLFGIRYLKNREGKSASSSVFGKD
jgi:hypothetical protein